MSLLLCLWAWHQLWDVLVGTSSLCDKYTMVTDTIKWTPACSFSELDTRITWNVSSKTRHTLHYIPFVTYTVIQSRILPWISQLTCGTIDTWAQTKFSFLTRNWNCLNASTNGMPSMSPIVPPNSTMHTWNESIFFLNFWYMAPT